jgi:DNA polymerase I-like protein with 3'-5' exonuclease and polymerase domains
MQPNFNLYIIDSEESFKELQELVKTSSSKIVSFDLETDSVKEKKAQIYGIGLSFEKDTAFYFPIKRSDTSDYWSIDSRNRIYDWVSNLFNQFNMIGWNLSYDTLVWEYNTGTKISQLIHTDCMLLKHVINEERPFGLKECAVTYLGSWADKAKDRMVDSIKANGGEVTQKNMEMFKSDTDILGEYCMYDVLLTRLLYEQFEPELDKQGLRDLFYKDEIMPLYREVTIDMKRRGFPIDVQYFQELLKNISADIVGLEKEIQFQIKEHTKTFVKALLDRDYAVKRAGVYPKVLANILKVTLPTKEGKITLNRKALELARDSEQNTCPSYYEWLLNNDDTLIPDTVLLEAQLQWFHINNPDQDSLFNLKSTDHVSWLFFDHFKEKSLSKTETGKQQCDDAFLVSIRDKYPFVKYLIDLKKLNKLRSTYIEGILEAETDGVIYCSFLQHGTTSGRYSCIAEGQTVSMPGGDKLIEQVEIGDLVYSFTSEGKPAIKKVTNVFNNGKKECIKLSWKSQGSHKLGTLICTPDHLLKTRTSGWKQASTLGEEERIYHLRRAINPVNGRARIYGPEYFMKNEEQMIKEYYFNGTSKQHAHHKNGNKLDNSIENIEVLSASEHIREHNIEAMKSRGRKGWEHLLLPENKPKPRYGEENPVWIKQTRYQLLKRLAKNGGSIVGCGMDFCTFKRKLQFAGIRWETIDYRYGAKGNYLSKGAVSRVLQENTKFNEKCIKLGVSFYKLKDLCRLFGLESNHKILSITPVGIKQVYDLEVEDTHNFIVNELCVHNCTSPNLQNLPRIKDDESGLSDLVLHYVNSIKEGFIAGKGYKIINADYSQLEAMCFAHSSGDDKLKNVFIRGEDLYSSIAIEVFGITGCSASKTDSNFLKKKYPELRNRSKVFCLAVVYGAEAGRISEVADIDYKAAEEIISSYLDAYPQLKDYMARMEYQAKKNGFVISDFGRIRHLPFAKSLHTTYGDRLLNRRYVTQNNLKDIRYTYKNALNNAKNFPIQGLAAHITNRALIRTNRLFKEHGVDGGVVAMVHDEICCIAREDQAELAKELLQEAMENTTKISVPLIASPIIGRNWKECK